MSAYAKPIWSFWVIGTLGVIWYAMGVMNLVGQQSEAMLASYSDTARAIVESQPIWATIGFVIGMIGGLLGSILLLLRKPLAFLMFIASFLGIIVQLAHGLRFFDRFGIGEIVGYVILPVLVAIFFIWYARNKLA